MFLSDTLTSHTTRSGVTLRSPNILLVAGDKAGRWTQWYREAIPLAEQRYERYLKERHDEEEHQR